MYIDLTDTLNIWLLTKYLLSTEGRWKVVAKFIQGKENIFSREFEVKKYGESFILPSDSARVFSVGRLTTFPLSPFIVTLTPKTSHLRLGLHDILHAIVMRISTVKTVL